MGIKRHWICRPRIPEKLFRAAPKRPLFMPILCELGFFCRNQHQGNTIQLRAAFDMAFMNVQAESYQSVFVMTIGILWIFGILTTSAIYVRLSLIPCIIFIHMFYSVSQGSFCFRSSLSLPLSFSSSPFLSFSLSLNLSFKCFHLVVCMMDFLYRILRCSNNKRCAAHNKKLRCANEVERKLVAENITTKQNGALDEVEEIARLRENRNKNEFTECIWLKRKGHTKKWQRKRKYVFALCKWIMFGSFCFSHSEDSANVSCAYSVSSAPEQQDERHCIRHHRCIPASASIQQKKMFEFFGGPEERRGDKGDWVRGDWSTRPNQTRTKQTDKTKTNSTSSFLIFVSI